MEKANAILPAPLAIVVDWNQPQAYSGSAPHSTLPLLPENTAVSPEVEARSLALISLGGLS
jgi:hypothetical protein